MLNLTKKEYWEIDIGVIENKIERLLGLTVEIIPDGEMHNGYTPCSVDAIDMSDEIKEYKDGSQWAMGLHGWMDHLCFLNAIPHGSYLVDHSW